MSSINVVEVSQNAEYNCRVHSYALGHSEMNVEAIHRSGRDDKFYIHFRHVICFSGPMSWHGALLRIAPDKEYLDFMRIVIPELVDIADVKLLDQERFGQLFIFDSIRSKVQIVANSATKLTALR